MKREAALQPLSHQHHNTLMGCLLIQKGVQKKADKKVLKDFTLRLWNDDVRPHLANEEKVLFPYLDRIDKRFKQIVITDHERIRLLADRLEKHEDGYVLYSTLANLLEQHIRFEERLVFNKIQDRVTPEELVQIGHSLNGIQSRKCSDYPVKFWE